MIQTGVHPYSSRYVPQRYSEDKHGPHNDILPQYGVSRQRQTGQGNIGIHARKDRRFICAQCRKTFAATHGTVCYRLRTSADLVALIVTLLAHGCPVQAIVAAFGFGERTVAAWEARAGRQGQAVHGHLVEQPRDLGQVQADEIRVKKQGGIVWMALAMMVKTRLWLADEVSEHRDMTMAAGITDHCWSVQELLSYPVPPSRWTPPKQRGRLSRALTRLIERWCGDHG